MKVPQILRILEIPPPSTAPTPSAPFPLSMQEEAPDSLEVRAALLKAARDSRSPDQWEAICSLWDSKDSQQAQNRDLLHRLVTDIMHQADHPHTWDAVLRLWSSGGHFEEQNRINCRPFLVEAARNTRDFQKWHQIMELWDAEQLKRSPHPSAFCVILLEIAHHARRCDNWEVLLTLWEHRGGGQIGEQIRTSISPFFLETLQSTEHPQWWNIVLKLWDEQDEQQNPGIVDLRSRVLEIARNTEHPHHTAAQNLLRTNGKPEDLEASHVFGSNRS